MFTKLISNKNASSFLSEANKKNSKFQMKNIRKILIFGTLGTLVHGKIMDGGLCLIKYATRAECVVDYGELGTFSTEYPWSKIDECNNDGSTFDVLGRRPAVVPSSPEKIGTYFSLLTKDMRKLSEAVNFNLDDDLEKKIGKKFKPNAKTLIFVHGWNSDSGDIALPDKLLSETHPRQRLSEIRLFGIESNFCKVIFARILFSSDLVC